MHWHHNQSSWIYLHWHQIKRFHSQKIWIHLVSLLPTLTQVVHNNGGKFIGYAFVCLLHVLGLEDIPTIRTIHSMQMYVVLDTLLISHPPQTPQYIYHLIDDRLATLMYSMSSFISLLLKMSMGALKSSQNMLSNVSPITEWQTITAMEKH